MLPKENYTQLKNLHIASRVLQASTVPQAFILPFEKFHKYAKILAETPQNVTTDMLSVLHIHFAFAHITFTSNDEISIFHSLLNILINSQSEEITLGVMRCLFPIVYFSDSSKSSYLMELVNILAQFITTNNLHILSHLLNLLTELTTKSKRFTLSIFSNINYKYLIQIITTLNIEQIQQQCFNCLTNLTYSIKTLNQEYAEDIISLTIKVFHYKIRYLYERSLRCIRYIAIKGSIWPRFISSHQIIPHLNFFLSNDSPTIVFDTLCVLEQLLYGNEICDNVDILSIIDLMGTYSCAQLKSAQFISAYLNKFPESAEVLINLGNLVQYLRNALENASFEMKLQCVGILRSLICNCSIKEKYEIIKQIDIILLVQMQPNVAAPICLLIFSILKMYCITLQVVGDSETFRSMFLNDMVQKTFEELSSLQNEQISNLAIEFLQMEN